LISYTGIIAVDFRNLRGVVDITAPLFLSVFLFSKLSHSHMKNLLFLSLFAALHLVSASQTTHICGIECSHVDHDFEREIEMRRASRNQDVFTKSLPFAIHNINGAMDASQIEAIWETIEQGLEGTDIIPCKHNEFFYQEWEIDPDSVSYSTWQGPNLLYGMAAIASSNTLGDACNVFVMEYLGPNIGGFSWANQNALTPHDGVYVIGDLVISNTLIHEIGHYCGLFHTFDGGGCSEDDCTQEGDRVCDTPPTYTNISCSIQPFCPDADVTNYMDYTGSCRDHFTAGQIERMHAALVNGGRSIVWQSGACADHNSFDVALLSVDNYFDCAEDFTPEIKIANWTNNDAFGVDVSVTMETGMWVTTADVPANTIITLIGEAIPATFWNEYSGTAEIYWSQDENASNDITSFTHKPKDLAVLSVDIQHDIWPENEQWKLFKEGVCCGDPIYANGVYAKGGAWGSWTSYDNWDNGFTYEPLFTHDEICLTEGCYGGFFRHNGYGQTQDVWDPSLGEIEGGMHVYIKYGSTGATETLYQYVADTIFDADNYEFQIGYIGGPSTDYEYDLCVEESYAPTPEGTCLGDFNMDGVINLQDLLALCSELGKEGAACTCDTDGDFDVDTQDFLNFIAVYGTDCEGNELAPPTVRQLEDLNLNPVYYTLDGKRVKPGPVPFGIYLAEIEIEGIRQVIKVVQ
jgi:hypothetical protein